MNSTQKTDSREILSYFQQAFNLKAHWNSTIIIGGQYFYVINLGNGWQINGSPTYAYNHNAAGVNEWTFPLAVGVSKTTIINGRPWKFSLQYRHYIESPDSFGPDSQIRFSISPVFKLPW